jgi:hypothetical protein
MSQFNQITPQEPPKSAPAKKSNSIIYWVVILILLTACVYLFTTKKTTEENGVAMQQKAQQRMDSLSTDRASLQADFDAASAKIDQLVTQNSKMDSALQGDKSVINRLQGQIRSILANKKATLAELQQAKDLIASLTDKTKQYEARIAELEKENTVLTGQNKTLTKERDSTNTQNVAIKKLASVLHASNIRLEAIHKRRNGKEKGTTKAKKADVLRVTFDIDENRITESGSKQIYLRIIAPDGNVLSNPAFGSGMLSTSKGDQLSYTTLRNVPLSQNQKVNNIITEWNQEGDYNKGTYTIEIYNDGFKVGSGDVTLK